MPTSINLLICSQTSGFRMRRPRLCSNNKRVRFHSSNASVLLLLSTSVLHHTTVQLFCVTAVPATSVGYKHNHVGTVRNKSSQRSKESFRTVTTKKASKKKSHD